MSEFDKCKNHFRCFPESMCNGLPHEWDGDVKQCYEEGTNKRYYCSRMDALCPQATTCYSETVEVTDTDCNQGYVLVTDVDNKEHRYMYSEKDLLGDVVLEPVDRTLVKAQFSCGHYEDISVEVDEIGVELAMALSELCSSCQRELDKQYEEECDSLDPEAFASDPMNPENL